MLKEAIEKIEKLAKPEIYKDALGKAYVVDKDGEAREIIPEAVEAAKENAKLNGLTNCEFIAGDVLKVIDEIEEKPDYIIRYGVPQMVYISCKPTSLARDLEVLQARGYEVKKVCCVDMFPATVHVESVVLMQYCGK